MSLSACLIFKDRTIRTRTIVLPDGTGVVALIDDSTIDEVSVHHTSPAVLVAALRKAADDLEAKAAERVCGQEVQYTGTGFYALPFCLLPPNHDGKCSPYTAEAKALAERLAG